VILRPASDNAHFMRPVRVKNKLCILAVDCTFGMPNLSLIGRHELSTGLQLQKRIKIISHCCHAGSQLGAKGAVCPQFLIANIESLSKNCHDRVKPIIYSTKL